MQPDSELLKQYRHVPDWQHSVPMRWQPSLYEAIEWRKVRERQGWRNAFRFPPMVRAPIEYQALFAGRIWKGRVLLLRYRYEDGWTHGSPMWLLIRRHEVSAAVWRKAGH